MTNDRWFCPITKIELINIREDGKLKPDAIKFNDLCKSKEICPILDLKSTIPVKVVVFQVRTFLDKEIFRDSQPVTIRVVCHNDKDC